MGALIFILLFVVGLILSTVGSIISLVDAFRVSVVWGLVSFFIPFALLVYCIKFWNRKWAKNGLLISLGGLALALLSFFLGGGLLAQRLAQLRGDAQEEAAIDEAPQAPLPGTEPTEGEAVPEAGTPAPAEGDAAAEDGELFQEMLPGLPNAFDIAQAELIPSTDPNERFQEIEKDRADPYAYVPVVPPPPEAPPAPEDSPNQTDNQGDGTIVTGPGGIGQPGTAPEPVPLDPLPDLPEPTVTASQVVVSGMVQINGETYAIVQAPGEPTSRYVKAGDRLANGSILVKRIETRPGSQPVVVLEERGVEIALPVGANVGDTETTATAPRPDEAVASLPTFQ